MNLVRGQQQEPTESNLLFEMGAGRNPLPLGGGGRQGMEKIHKITPFETHPLMANCISGIFLLVRFRYTTLR